MLTVANRLFTVAEVSSICHTLQRCPSMNEGTISAYQSYWSTWFGRPTEKKHTDLRWLNTVFDT